MAILSKQSILVKRGASHPPRSRAFFLEFLLNMLIFALCAVIALQVFVQGKLVTDQSAALSTLTLDAKDLAGYYKVTNGDVKELASVEIKGAVGELASDGSLTYYYSRSLQPSEAEDARYRLVLTSTSPAPSAASSSGLSSPLSTMQISAYVDASEAEEELFSFEVVNYRPEQRGGG